MLFRSPIDRAEIDALRLCVDRCGAAVEPHHFLEVGERVRVRAGILQGVEGLITRKKGACRLILSIALIHQSVAVDIDGSLLEIIPAVPQATTSELRASSKTDSGPGLAVQLTEARVHKVVNLQDHHSSSKGIPLCLDRW